MRGTGTSPRELQAAERQAQVVIHREAELERLVMAIPHTYANHPAIAEANICEAFDGYPDHRRRSLEILAELNRDESAS
jgi:hypothetical protein